MMKMLIRLDRNKVENKGYSYDAIIQTLDKLFANSACTKEEQSNGAILYIGNPSSDDHMRDFGILYMRLSEAKWFADTCCEWKWYDNDGDDEEYSEEDVLSKERRRNQLFAQV